MNLRPRVPAKAPSACSLAGDSFPPLAIRFRISSAAFTLVEILIALGIFSMVLAAIYSTWTAILRASKVGRDAAAAVQRARMAGRTIEESLGSAQSFVANQAYYAFVAQNGNDASLSFVSHLSPSFPRSGKFAGLDIRRVTFSLEQSHDGGEELVLRQQPLMMDLDLDEKNFPLVLAKYVKEFKTEFWDTRLQDWVDEWKQTNQLPVLVRVSLKLADNAFSSQVRQEVTRIVSLPSVAVAPIWQSPRLAPGVAPGTQPLPGQGLPGQPLPGQPIPGQPGFPGTQFPSGAYPNYPPPGVNPQFPR